jgi:hypothetical protein
MSRKGEREAKQIHGCWYRGDDEQGEIW